MFKYLIIEERILFDSAECLGLEAEEIFMYIFLTVLIVSVCCVISIKIFMKDSKHDMEIQVGKFRFSIKKHDKE